jgi:hypothetical protein
MDEGRWTEQKVRVVFFHPTLASGQKTEKIASRHKTHFVARKIAKLMFHSITQLTNSATNPPSPKMTRVRANVGEGARKEN